MALQVLKLICIGISSGIKHFDKEQQRSASSSSRGRPPNEMPGIKMYSSKDIMGATEGLSNPSYKSESLDVYKSCLNDGTEVSIMVTNNFKFSSDVHLDEFLQLLGFYRDARHPNIRELVGACIDPVAIVCKKLPDRNLEECLEMCPGLLTWQIRVLIISQICSVLLFLYSNWPRPIVHGNLTPGYIFLDSSFNCTLLLPGGFETEDRKLGSDVHSLGVTILRLLTGLPVPDIQRGVLDEGDWAARNFDCVAGSWPFELVKELAYFGSKFCKSTSSPLEEVLKDLGNITVVINDHLAANKLFTEDNEETKGELGSGISSNPSDGTSRFKSFTNSEIESATDGLSESSKIGEGGYGSVYRGHLEDNTQVAIKMLAANSSQGSSEFVQELDFLGDLRHPHIVRLIGACFNLRALVYEFLPSGSIEDCLKERPNVLTWQMRTRIIHEICTALIFLHSRKPKPIVHGDLKPDNILLDYNFSIKIADFGLSRFMSEGTSTTATDAFHQTKNIKGTNWYIDPDFIETLKLTPGCDVYAFGITILRILTRGPPARILGKVERAIRRKTLMTIVDSAAGDWPDEVAEYLASVGLECCEPERKCSRLMLEISNGLKDILAKIAS